MLKPNNTDNETHRLSTLKSLDLLDSPPEERFDRVTRIAKGSFDVPIALVSLIDENRQWFKSCFGLNVRQTERDISFCGHAILGRDIFVIEDALADERFADNPLVTGAPFIRFYAGCPLRAPNGDTIGTLCIIDQRKRTFSETDRQELSYLGALVEQELIEVRAQTMDEETGTSNKLGLLELARYTVNRCINLAVPVSIAIFDLEANASASEQEVIEATLEVTKKFKSVLRELDIFARVNKTRFMLLLSNCEEDEADMILSVYLTAALDELESKGLNKAIIIKTKTELLSDNLSKAMTRLDRL